MLRVTVSFCAAGKVRGLRLPAIGGSEAVLPELPIDDDVWAGAYELARRARAGGVSVPATDILIAVCARRHGAELESADAYFERLAQV